MKKILVISFFFPPRAKAGTHRAYSMAEFLPKFGWEPVFIAPSENGYYGRPPRVDYGLLKLVRKYPICRIPLFSPFQNESLSLIARSTRRLWEAILPPDSRIVWNIAIKRELDVIIKNHKPDIVFITGTPFSSFLLAPHIKKEYDLPVILDYRDPWSGNPEMERTFLRKKTNLYFEKKALKAADLVTTASYHMIDFIKEAIGESVQSKIFYGFPYGFNREFLCREIQLISHFETSKKIIGTFAGSVHGNIDVNIILSAIKSAIDKEHRLAGTLEINCYGTLFGCSNKPDILIAKYGLEENVKIFPFLPYIDFLKILSGSSFLILPHGVSPLAKVLYPTKFFDYLGLKRPILYIGGKGQVWETIQQCVAGVCVKPDPLEIAESLITLSDNWNTENWYTNEQIYQQFNRSNIFNAFCKRLENLI